jgi:ADP-heptose:LPS heptosyltransferase
MEKRTPTDVAQQLAAARRLLLVRLRSLGDSILSLPLIDALRSWRPELLIDVAVEAPFAPVFSHHPAVNETLVLRPRGARGVTGWSRLHTIREFRRRCYDVALNLHGGSTSLWLTVASGAELTIGQASHRQSWMYGARIPPSSTVWKRERLHTVEHQLTPLRWLGLPIPVPPTLRLYPNPALRETFDIRLQSAGLAPEEYVVIHPTATLETKQWLPDRFASVADAVSREFGLRVLFTAAASEQAVLERVRKVAHQEHLYWNDLELDGLFWIISNCRLFVGNDSGPTHVAAALDKPLVVVWGSSNFAAWHPWGKRYEAVRSDLPCIPCPGYECAEFGRPRCILDIPVDPVIEACRRILRE